MARWPIPPTRDVVFLYTRLNELHKSGQILTRAQIRKIAEATSGDVPATTDDLAEGTTNLYHTDVRAVNAIKADADWNAANWDLAFSWGDHAAVGYLTSETDPTVPAHVKAVTETQIGNWDAAFGWGDHAAAGYIVGPFSDVIHGDRAGGTLHAAATGAVAGFMSPADKTKLDGLNPLELQTSTDGTLGWVEVALSS